MKDKLTEIVSRYLHDLQMPGKVERLTINTQELESVLYKTLRCSIVHELRFPDNIKLSRPERMSAPIEAHANGTIVFSNRLPLALMFTVVHDVKVVALRKHGGDGIAGDH